MSNTNNNQTKDNFAEFTKQLQDGLKKEVERRKTLQRSESIITNHPGRHADEAIKQEQPVQQHSQTPPNKTSQDAEEIQKALPAAEPRKNHTDSDMHGPSNEPQEAAKDEKPMKKVAKQSILRNIRHLLPEALLTKTHDCQHDHGCFENVVRDALKRFLIGFCIQMLLKNITMIFKPAKLLRNLKKAKNLVDSTRFGLFLMCFQTAYKLVLCLLRRFGTKDSFNAPVAGFVSGLSMAIDSSNRRELITVLTMSRAIESSFNMGESSGVIPKIAHKDWILWLISNCFLQSCMGLKQGILSKSISKFFATWSQMKQNDKILVNVWHRMLADGVPGF